MVVVPKREGGNQRSKEFHSVLSELSFGDDSFGRTAIRRAENNTKQGGPEAKQA